MNIAILGFTDYNEVEQEMEKLMAEVEVFIFSVVCGGVKQNDPRKGIGEIWAERHGAPRLYVWNENIVKLQSEIVKLSDFILAKGDNAFAKGTAMKLAAAGGHGRIV